MKSALKYNFPLLNSLPTPRNPPEQLRTIKRNLVWPKIQREKKSVRTRRGPGVGKDYDKNKVWPFPSPVRPSEEVMRTRKLKHSKQVAPKRSDISTVVVAGPPDWGNTGFLAEGPLRSPIAAQPNPSGSQISFLFFFFPPSPNTGGSDVRRMWAVPPGSALEWSKFKGAAHVEG